MARLLALASLFAPLVGAERVVSAFPAIPTVTVTAVPDVPKGSYVKGRDGGSSFLFAGQGVMTFGDTVLSKANTEGRTWVVNTMAHSTDATPDDGITSGYNYKTAGQPANQWIPYTAAEIAYNQTGQGLVGLWPAAPFKDPNTGKQYLFYSKIIEHPGAGWDNIGTGISQVLSLTAPTLRIAHRPGETEETMLFLPSDRHYSAMAVVTGGYLYGFSVDGGDWGKLRVARAPLAGEAFLTRSNWRFRNGSNWVSTASSATVVLSTVNGGSIEWNPYLKCWLYTYMGYLNDKIFFRVADNPWGPWSAPTQVAVALRNSKGALPYLARAQKILEKENGRTQYIVYCMAGEGDWTSRMPMLKVRFN